MIRGLASLVAVVAVAGCTGAGLPPPGTDVPTAPTVTALPAGTYTSVNFQPAVTFTVPDGWVLGQDGAGYLQLHPVGNDLVGIHLFRDPQAASQDAACPAAPEPGRREASRPIS